MKGYEAIYYNNIPDRLRVCSINNHWLLHLPACIEANGPACNWWAFPLERYCYEVKQAATSKSRIDMSVANALVRIEQMNAIRLFYSADLHCSHPDSPDPTRYPLLKDRIGCPDLHEKLPLSQQLRNRLSAIAGEPHITIEYFKRCLLSKEVTIGSKASQRDQEDNRKDYFICYHGSGGGCLFGTVYGFMRVGDSGAIFALVRRWGGVEADMEVHQITYLRDNGPWDLVKAKSIRCLVGVIVELDHGHTGWDTKMIIGALEEVAIAGIEQQHVYRRRP